MYAISSHGTWVCTYIHVLYVYKGGCNGEVIVVVTTERFHCTHIIHVFACIFVDSSTLSERCVLLRKYYGALHYRGLLIRYCCNT